MRQWLLHPLLYNEAPLDALEITLLQSLQERLVGAPLLADVTRDADGMRELTHSTCITRYIRK